MLTPSQQTTLTLVKNFVLENELLPTLNDLCVVSDTENNANITEDVAALLAAGYLYYHDRENKTLGLTQADEWAVPLKGRIAAGEPLEVIPQPDLVNLPELFAGRDRFLLEVKGDSMLGDHICDGDWVLCEASDSVNNPEIAVVLIDHEVATLKRLHHNQTEGTTELIPSNPMMSSMTYPTERISVQGRYIGIIRMANRK